jgi:serine protease
VIVKYQEGAPRSARAAVQRHTGTRYAGKLPGGPRTLRIADGATVGEKVAELRRHRDVAYAVPNYVAHASDFVPNDPGGAGTPGGWQAMQWDLAGPASVNAPLAWDYAIHLGAPGGRGAIVAVIDTGVAYESYKRFKKSPDLYRQRFVRGFDFVDDDRHPNDQNGHGTHVTSTIAEATNNAFGLVGLAYGAKIMPLRVLDSEGAGDAAAISRAIRYAAKNGANVINMSLEFDTTVTASQIPEIVSAARYAHHKGVVMVAAAGNEADTAVAYPARASTIISVGATTEHACQAEYSNSGPGLDVVAPGGGDDAPNSDNPADAASCNPGKPARPIFQVTFSHDGSIRRFGLRGSEYEGTSMASPHVAAIAALIIATHRLGNRPSPNAVQLRIQQTARDLGPPGYDTRYGYGLINAGAATDPNVPVG